MTAGAATPAPVTAINERRLMLFANVMNDRLPLPQII
jgi:hypothetical protein